MSAIRRLLDKIRPKTAEYTVVIAGESRGGKTTLVYLLKEGRIVQTVSSIGFNVQTFDAPNTSGQPLKLTGWDFGAGCQPNGHSMRFLLQHLPKCDAIIWIVDASKPERLAENVGELTGLIDKVVFDEDSSKQDLPILILANKQDLPNTIPMSRLYDVFAKTLSNHSSCIFPTSSLATPIEKSGLPEAFEWLRMAFTNVSLGKNTHDVQPRLPELRDPNHLAFKLDSWVSRAEAEIDNPDQFISRFESVSLPAWDHYTHIRIVFFILVMYGRQRGKDIIFQGIEKYITQSPQARGRTFHFTMTYFWIQIVHLGIRNMLPSVVGPQTDSETDVTAKAKLVSPHQFALFLALNPKIVEEHLWMEFYSKEVMMSSAARSEMVFPDKKQLPNVVMRDAIEK
ncbi:hypothetical protein H0H92_004374 [Tricholoma furcatifolium]|nr:hypothetical protein H0H92_004374 [Tricholoma furcatifolium]